MAFANGSRFGRYDVIAPLGQGGMGDVYRASDTRLKREVAIKSSPGRFRAGADRVARFQREAELSLRSIIPTLLRSTGWTKVDTSTGSGQAATGLVLELVEGDTLADLIARSVHARRRVAERATDRGSARGCTRERRRPLRSEAGEYQAHA